MKIIGRCISFIEYRYHEKYKTVRFLISDEKVTTNATKHGNQYMK